MAILFDFTCEDGHTNEHFVSSETTTVECKTCGKLATRIVTPPRIHLDPLSGDFPGSTFKWAKARDQKLQQERKANS